MERPEEPQGRPAPRQGGGGEGRPPSMPPPSGPPQTPRPGGQPPPSGPPAPPPRGPPSAPPPTGPPVAPPHGAPPPAPPPVAAPPAPAGARRVPCPRCGELAEPGQEICLRCGAPVGRAYRRPPSWRLPAALAALGVLLVGAGAGFGIAELTHDNKSKKKPISLTPKQTVTPTPTGPTTPTGPSGPSGTTGPSGPSGPTGASTSVTLTSWPGGQKGWTVVLMIGKDRNKVEDRARAAARASISAGVLKGDDYKGFKPGVWVAFMGQYDKRAGAQKAKKTYASKGFSGKPRQITPKKK